MGGLGFDPSIPIEQAHTPPAAWYLDPRFYQREVDSVFRRSWQAVARADQLRRPGDYVAGVIAGEPWVAVVNREADLRAFFNVCRHHAACIAQGAGRTDALVCPYHGWTYDLEGRLRRAPRLGGVKDFDRAQYGLVPIHVQAWESLVFIRLGEGGPPLSDILAPIAGICGSGLQFVARRAYELACNWKVYVDNYLDGGYHVPVLHTGLAAQLDLDSYRTDLFEWLSVQSCGEPDHSPAATIHTRGDGGLDFPERLAGGARYAFVYPNFTINRYGPMMDTNWVVPLGPERTTVVFDYYADPSVADDADFIERSLAASHQVQEEDTAICESVQRGLASSSYDRGRYAPRVEQAAHHFHRLLARDLPST